MQHLCVFPEDKLEQQHALFTQYKDPCRLGPGEDKPWALGENARICMAAAETADYNLNKSGSSPCVDGSSQRLVHAHQARGQEAVGLDMKLYLGQRCLGTAWAGH